MYISMKNARWEFSSFVKALNTGFQSEHWLCARVHDPDFPILRANDAVMTIGSMALRKYLETMEGRLFWYSDEVIYILSCTHSAEALERVAYDVADILLGRHSPTTEVTVYALRDQRMDIDQCALEEDMFFQMPTLNSSGDLACPVEPQNEGRRMNFLQTNALLIEDDRTTRNIVKTAMEGSCHMTTVDTMTKGLGLFMDNPPDVIFLDIDLPDGNGYQALEFMLWSDPDAYIVMFSGQDDEDSIEKALKMGAKGFISKPFVKESMMDYLYGCNWLAA